MNYSDAGFTGTQQGMTKKQHEVVSNFVRKLVKTGTRRFHHGLCVGADTDFHDIVRHVGLRLATKLTIIGHPPINQSKVDMVVLKDCDELRMAKEYLDRNTDIVMETTLQIATPKENSEVLRSGTWSTVRRARKKGNHVLIVYPNGDYVISGNIDMNLLRERS